MTELTSISGGSQKSYCNGLITGRIWKKKLLRQKNVVSDYSFP
ncbi:hypothetical protein STRIC_2343 [Streptococcus ictaluri 707-05]|uniref:Uncharacterized protein n=1 Tax=Streptococcus ictaluri 707-05 TaxID=764299 RepID=G5K1T5_9STRE|nr:hypothetical protein STRIC_2343 [Streptococcus ictaluri 707-05]